MYILRFLSLNIQYIVNKLKLDGRLWSIQISKKQCRSFYCYNRIYIKYIIFMIILYVYLFHTHNAWLVCMFQFWGVGLCNIGICAWVLGCILIQYWRMCVGFRVYVYTILAYVRRFWGVGRYIILCQSYNWVWVLNIISMNPMMNLNEYNLAWPFYRSIQLFLLRYTG